MRCMVYLLQLATRELVKLLVSDDIVDGDSLCIILWLTADSIVLVHSSNEWHNGE